MLFLAQLSAQRCGSEFMVTGVTLLGMGRGTTNIQIVVHVVVPDIGILNQFIVQESYKSNYSTTQVLL